jgi:hypothetical protein
VNIGPGLANVCWVCACLQVPHAGTPALISIALQLHSMGIAHSLACSSSRMIMNVAPPDHHAPWGIWVHHIFIHVYCDSAALIGTVWSNSCLFSRQL